VTATDVDSSAPDESGDDQDLGQSKPFLGWKMARAGIVIQMLHSGLVFNAFSLFSAQLQADFGWSNSTLGGAFALNRAESGLLGPLQGWMTDKYGPKAILRLGAVIMAAGLYLFSTIDTVVGFYLTYLLIAMGSSLSGFLTITVAVVHWFERKRSKALAITSLGFAIGGALAFGVGIVIATVGWRRTAQLAAVLVLITILPLSKYFVRKPSDVGQYPDGIEPTPTPTSAGSRTAGAGAPTVDVVTPVHFSASEAMRTRAFWFISFGHASALLVVGASMAHLAVFLQDESTLGPTQIAVVIGLLPAMMGVGQLLGGVLGDKYNKRWLLSAAMLGHGAGLFVLAISTGPAMIWLFVVLHGLAWGVRGPLQQALRADYFGATDFGKIMGFSSLIVMTGMVVGPIAAGFIADTTGSFRLGFAVLAFAAATGSLWFWFATPPNPPQRSEAEGGPALSADESDGSAGEPEVEGVAGTVPVVGDERAECRRGDERRPKRLATEAHVGDHRVAGDRNEGPR
jgi:MFS family permease